MLWTDFVVVFFMALLLSGAFAAAARSGLLGRAPRGLLALLWIFLVILLGSSAGGLWLGRVGPQWWGISWLGFFVSALGIALLVATLSLANICKHRAPPRSSTAALPPPPR
jgi:predicted permease